MKTDSTIVMVNVTLGSEEEIDTQDPYHPGSRFLITGMRVRYNLDTKELLASDVLGVEVLKSGTKIKDTRMSTAWSPLVKAQLNAYAHRAMQNGPQ